jgi:DnaJ-domain-containing protein 1
VDFTERLGRILRGFATGGPGPRRPRLEDADPDDVLRDAGAPPPHRGGATRAGGPGLPPAVAKAYANLELTPPASLDEAKAAWRKLMAKYHPDRHQGDERKLEVATKVAAQLTEAYRVVREHLER